MSRPNMFQRTIVAGPKIGNDQLWKIDGLFWVENQYGKFHICKNLIGQQVLEVVNSDQNPMVDSARTIIRKTSPTACHFTRTEHFGSRTNTASGAFITNGKGRAVMTKEHRRTGNIVVTSATGTRRNDHVMKCDNMEVLRAYKPMSRM